MSVMSESGEKTFLPSPPCAEFPQLTELEREYAGENAQRWKRLVSLRMSLSGFPLDVIARTFAHTPTTAKRHIEDARRDLLALARQKGLMG